MGIDRLIDSRVIQIKNKKPINSIKSNNDKLAQAVAEIRKMRKGRKLGGISLRTLIEEGRRY
jgi:hypothetical protein